MYKNKKHKLSSAELEKQLDRIEQDIVKIFGVASKKRVSKTIFAGIVFLNLFDFTTVKI